MELSTVLPRRKWWDREHWEMMTWIQVGDTEREGHSPPSIPLAFSPCLHQVVLADSLHLLTFSVSLPCSSCPSFLISPVLLPQLSFPFSSASLPLYFPSLLYFSILVSPVSSTLCWHWQSSAMLVVGYSATLKIATKISEVHKLSFKKQTLCLWFFGSF